MDYDRIYDLNAVIVLATGCMSPTCSIYVDKQTYRERKVLLYIELSEYSELNTLSERLGFLSVHLPYWNSISSLTNLKTFTMQLEL